MLEILFRILFVEFLGEFLGKRVVLLFFLITKDKRGLEWITKPEDQMAGFTGGCLINIVGLLTFMGLFFGLFYIYDILIGL